MLSLYTNNRPKVKTEINRTILSASGLAVHLQVWAAWVLDSESQREIREDAVCTLNENILIEYNFQSTLEYIGGVLLLRSGMIEVVLNDRLGKKVRTLLSFGDANYVEMIINVCLCDR